MASCLSPFLAVSVGKTSEDKHILHFFHRGFEELEYRTVETYKRVYGEDNVFLLSCGQCEPCRENYAKDWSIRCVLEAQCHKHNYFLTLTYDDQHYLKAGKADFDNFLKKLNYHLSGKAVRPKFFACLERGGLTGRKHFHCVLFLDSSLQLNDPVKIGTFIHYRSTQVEDIWKNGFVDVAEFQSDCARYVAKYASKQGRCFMSRNLAKTYYLKHRDDIIKDDFKVYGQFSGREYVDIPDCFVRWFVEDHVSEVQDFKLHKKDIQKLIIRNRLKVCDFSSPEYKKYVDFVGDFDKKHEHSKERNIEL